MHMSYIESPCYKACKAKVNAIISCADGDYLFMQLGIAFVLII